jgi:hypothetical protein
MLLPVRYRLSPQPLGKMKGEKVAENAAFAIYGHTCL